MKMLKALKNLFREADEVRLKVVWPETAEACRAKSKEFVEAAMNYNPGSALQMQTALYLLVMAKDLETESTRVEGSLNE